MTIDTTQVLKNFDGEPLKDVNSQGKVYDVTLRTALVNALLHPQGAEKDAGTDKLVKYELAKKIHQQESVTLTEEEAILCLSRVGLVYGALAYGIIRDRLNEVE